MGILKEGRQPCTVILASIWLLQQHNGFVLMLADAGTHGPQIACPRSAWQCCTRLRRIYRKPANLLSLIVGRIQPASAARPGKSQEC
eukprot:1150310-Pelagomonas_calceolata.AAC.2